MKQQQGSEPDSLAPQPVQSPAAMPLQPAIAAILRAQASAGNAAVARAILARDDVPFAGAPLTGFNPVFTPQEMPIAVAMKVDGYLETMRLSIQMHNSDGTSSMPELVNQIRQNVPDALTVTPYQIEMEVSKKLGTDTPPAARAKASSDGNAAQLEASILNSLPKPPTEFKIYAGPGSLAFSLSGIEAKAGPVTAKVSPSGGEVGVKEGDKSVTGSASFKGDSFGLKATAGNASFDASISKDDTTKQWSKWSANVKIPIAGGETVEERPPIEDITASVAKAQSAISDVINYLRNGGSPTDDFVKTKMGDIKPAISKVSSAVEQRKGPKASVKLSVGGGDPKLGTYGTISLVVEF
jgi:hypothetical protein